MEPKDIAQLVVSAVAPFVAVGGALLLAAYHRRERIACVISYGMTQDMTGRPQEASFLSVHNLTGQNVAINRLRYLSGFPRRGSKVGTALEFSDPYDLNFPYMVGPGEIRNFHLDEAQALRLASDVKGVALLACRLLRRDRIAVEATTTTGLRKKVAAEAVLQWTDRAPWARDS